MVIFFEANEHFRESKGHELLRSLHSVLNEKLDFSYRLVKIKLKFSSPSKFMDPLKSTHGTLGCMYGCMVKSLMFTLGSNRLSVKQATFCPESFFYGSQFFPHIQHCVAFKTETQVVYCAVRTKSLDIIHVRVSR
jgi:hypothetical protein